MERSRRKRAAAAGAAPAAGARHGTHEDGLPKIWAASGESFLDR